MKLPCVKQLFICNPFTLNIRTKTVTIECFVNFFFFYNNFYSGKIFRGVFFCCCWGSPLEALLIYIRGKVLELARKLLHTVPRAKTLILFYPFFFYQRDDFNCARNGKLMKVTFLTLFIIITPWNIAQVTRSLIEVYIMRLFKLCALWMVQAPLF